MNRQRLACILALAVEDATFNLGATSHFRGHLLRSPAERSVYRHYHRIARRAWRGAARDFQQLPRGCAWEGVMPRSRP